MKMQPNSLSPAQRASLLSEKEIAKIFGPQTFPGFLVDMETVGWNYIFVLIYSINARLACLNINYHYYCDHYIFFLILSKKICGYTNERFVYLSIS